MTVAPRPEGRHEKSIRRPGLALIAPLCVGLAIVISSYAESAGYWSVLLRPIAVVAVLCLALGVAGRMLIHDPEVSVIASVMAVVLLAGHPIAFVALPAAGGWIVVRYFRHIRGLRRGADLSSAVTTLSMSYLGVALVTLALSGAISTRDFVLMPSPDASEVATARGRPNIYLLLLDGYARADSLRSVYGFDNEPFLSRLTDLGFDVYGNSHTEFDATSRTTTSMLSANTDDLPPATQVTDSTDRNELYREVRRRLAEAPALAELRTAGYQLIAIQPPVVHVVERGWDVEIDTGQVNDFEINLLSRSPLGYVLRGWVLEQQRQRIVESLAHWRPSSSGSPKVTLAHLMAPHPPFVFGRDVNEIPPLLCWPKICQLFASQAALLDLTEDEFRRRYATETAATNALVLPAIAQLVREDPQAVVIVMSDHGSRYSDIDVAERHRNLFAARTPQRPWLFGPSPTPRDLFRTLLVAYGPPS